MYKYFILFINLLLCQVALAQFSDTTHYHALFNGSGSANQAKDGNSYLLNNAFRFEVKKKSMQLNLSNSWIYGRSNDDLTNNDYTASLDFNLYKGFPHFYYWGLATYNTSFSLKINNQLLAGLGIAYSILDRPNAYLNISDGVLYDLSDLYVADTTRINYHTYRNSLRLQFRFLIKNLVTVDGGSFWQPSFNRKNDYNIRSTFNLGFKLNNWLNINSSLAYNKIAATSSENLLLTYGLRLEQWF